MNVQQFQEGVELMSHAGFKLTEMESALIEYSLIILQSEQKFRDVFFVGRIDTCGTDRYYIAFGYRKDILKGRKFFYSLNGYEWLMLPEVKPKMVPISRHARTFFKGDPAHIEFVSMVSVRGKLKPVSIFIPRFFIPASNVSARRRRSLPSVPSICKEDQRRRSLGLLCPPTDESGNRSSRSSLPTSKPMCNCQSLLPRPNTSRSK